MNIKIINIMIWFILVGTLSFSILSCEQLNAHNCNHNWEWKITKNTTIYEEGIETKTCNICGVTDGTRAIPLLYHSHNWQWIVTTPATTEVEGLETETCSFCGITNGIRPIQKLPSVYIAGNYFNGNISIACYWKNGVRTDLSTVYSNATGIVADDFGNIYISGFYRDASNYIACYWEINEMVITKIDLPNSIYDEGTSRSITLHSGILYIAGSKGYWKVSGTEMAQRSIYLSGEYTGGVVQSLVISPNGDVNMVGGCAYYYDGRRQYETLVHWKDNGTIMTATAIDQAYEVDAIDIVIDSNNVYILGRTLSSSWNYCYWKNGEKYFISWINPIEVTAMTIDSGNIFIVGKHYPFSSSERTCYWINGEWVDDIRVDNSSRNRANAIAVKSGILYIAGEYDLYNSSLGYSYSVACYWEGKQYYSETYGYFWYFRKIDLEDFSDFNKTNAIIIN